MKLRKMLFWLHLAAGVMAGVVILMMSVTGVLLAFERQIIAFAERETRAVQPPAPGAPRLNLDTVVEYARATVPDVAPSGLILHADPGTATLVNFGREQAVFVDPYTGAVRGNGATAARKFFHVVTDWHRWLGMQGDNRDFGRAVTGACNAAFIVLVVSGFYLWWPRRWTRPALRAVTVPSLTLRGKPRDWNWHNAFGLWSAPVLLFITVTGLVISYQWAGNLIYTLTGTEAPPPPRPPASPPAGATGGAVDARASRQPRAGGGGEAGQQGRVGEAAESSPGSTPLNMEAMFAAAVRQAPHWRLINMRLPQPGARQISVIIEEAESLHPYPRSTLTLDATTAGIVKWEPFAGYNLGRTIRFWVRPVHTGEAGGFIGQLIAALASAGGAVLVYTGLALAWRRFWQFVKRHRRAPSVTPGDNRDVARSHAS
jgi:uncharacterized iron-regulated membrane protein